jgi:L-threonylcarbamoyladenylate synthase
MSVLLFGFGSVVLGVIAQGLFGVLREMDDQGVDTIIMEGISEQHEGLAVMNRIRKAASKIIHV